jgi:transposase
MSENKSHPPSVDALPVLGIDVSKSTLDVCLIIDALKTHHRFANNAEGIKRMLAMLPKQGASRARVVMEATGSYSLAPATAAFEAGCVVSVVNPRRVLDFARSCGRRNKTDRVDAELIARFAGAQPLDCWQPLPAEQSVLRDLMRRQADVEAQLRAEKRRLDVAAAVPALRQSLTRAARWLDAERKRLEKSIQEHLRRHPGLAEDVARLNAIAGFGEKTSRLLAAEIPRHFRNARSTASWLGVVPRQFQSGSSVRKASRIGHAAPSLRSKLYFAAITAIRWDPRSMAFAQRLRTAGKSKMSIIFAVLHKLVRTAFALLKNHASYQPDHAVSLAL